MKTPPVVSAQEWEAALQDMLTKEKEVQRARDALNALRRRMPWTPVEKDYVFDGPDGKASLLDLFDGRRQLIVYRAFIEPGTGDDDVPGLPGWPDHGCVGCSLMADHVPNLAHLNARDTTFVYVSRATQPELERMKAKMGWRHPWFTITDDFDKDFDCDMWHATNAFIRDENDRVFPHLRDQRPRRRGVRRHLEPARHDRAWATRGLGGFAGGLSAESTVRVVAMA